jgi:hypothetical protein
MALWHVNYPLCREKAKKMGLTPISELLSTSVPDGVPLDQKTVDLRGPAQVQKLPISEGQSRMGKSKVPIRIGGNCFIALQCPVPVELASDFEKNLKPKLRAFLQHLRLDDARISLDCAMAGRTGNIEALKPTILFMCLNERQKKAIESGIGSKRNLISAQFVCRVVVQELRLISPFLSIPSSPILLAYYLERLSKQI